MKLLITEQQYDILVHGRTGNIYRAGEKVLKIIPDGNKREYDYFLKVKNNPHSNVVKIHKLKFNEKGGLKVWMEYLDEIEWLENYKIVYEKFTNELIDYSYQTDNFKDFYENFINDISFSFKTVIEREEKFQKLFRDVYEGWMHLRNLGIRFLDMTTDNVMQKNGIYKLIDFA